MAPVTKENVKRAVSESEFAALRWSVVSAEECAASGLSYDEAAKLVRQMSDSISGLCIVTDEAASRLYRKQQTKSNGQLPHVALPKTFAETL